MTSDKNNNHGYDQIMKIAIQASIFRLIGWVAHAHLATDSGGEKAMEIDAAFYLMPRGMMISEGYAGF